MMLSLAFREGESSTELLSNLYLLAHPVKKYGEQMDLFSELWTAFQ